jgi:hypothetical protein
VIAGLAALIPVLALASASLSSRYNAPGATTSESWHARFDSIRAGLGFLGRGLRELFFGVGPGQAEVLIVRDHVNRFGAIWSDAVRYIAETGVIGAAAAALVAGLVVRAIARSGAAFLGICCALAWLAGVVVMTSYLPLSPLWLFLALLLAWDHVFPRSEPASRVA